MINNQNKIPEGSETLSNNTIQISSEDVRTHQTSLESNITKLYGLKYIELEDDDLSSECYYVSDQFKEEVYELYCAVASYGEIGGHSAPRIYWDQNFDNEWREISRNVDQVKYFVFDLLSSIDSIKDEITSDFKKFENFEEKLKILAEEEKIYNAAFEKYVQEYNEDENLSSIS